MADPVKRPIRLAAAPLEPVDIPLSLLLQPSVVYTADIGSAVGIATLIIGAPGTEATTAKSALETLVDSLASWLLRTWSNGTGSWTEVVASLGQGRELAPTDWDTKLAGCLSTEVIFTLNPVDLCSASEDGNWALFPMFNSLQISWTGQESPIAFADHARTYPDHRQVVEAYFAQLSLSMLTDNPDARGALRFGAAAQDEPRGPSLTAYIFDDYFLMLCRQMASSLADLERSRGQAGGMPATDLVRTLGGLTSRYLMNGIRVPDPATTPADVTKVDLAKLDIASSYALNGQQFAFTTNPDAPPASITATLSLAPAQGEPVVSIPVQFAGGGTSVTSTMPFRVVPPAPRPDWKHSDQLLMAATASVNVVAIPSVRAESVWHAARERLPWISPGPTSSFIVPLPPALLRQSGGESLTLTVQIDPPQSPSPTGIQNTKPALMIQVPVSLVNRVSAGCVDSAGGPANPYYTNIYRVGGADNETRERIHSLLGAKALAGATVSVLYNAAGSGFESDTISLSAQPVLLAKTNLSTSTEPSLANLQLHRAVPQMNNDPLGPVSTLLPDSQNPGDPQNLKRLEDLLRLIWEVSVTQSDGYFLRYADASGQPLPVRTFTPKGQPTPTDGIANGDTATLTLLISFPESNLFHPWHNAFSIAPKNGLDGTLYIGVGDVAGKPLLQYQPSYPPGCIGFEADWSLANAMLAREEGSLRYNDALIAPMEWPGVRCAYRFDTGQLTLSLQFDPSLVIRTDPALAHVLVHGLRAGQDATALDRSKQQIRAALGRYATVVAQLADPHTAVTLVQSVMPANDGRLGDGSVIKAALATFANDVSQELSKALEGGKAEAVSQPLTIPINKTDLAKRTDDLFPVTVTLNLSRPPELVDEVARTGMPSSVMVAMRISADLDPPAEGTVRSRQRMAGSGMETVEDVGLTRFAQQFEACFYGFDGTNGMARLAVRTDTGSPAAGGGGASLWGMRWSKTNGIDVAFQLNQARYFTLLPLNTKLMGGLAQVPAYDPNTLAPTYTSNTFSDVDVDAWAQTFLSAFDEILAPASCAALAALDSDAYQRLMDLKAVIAKALANGVGPVFPSETGGDLAAAQDQFEQSVLTSLSTAYAVSAIVQVPADVSVVGASESGSLPPRFFGSLTSSSSAVESASASACSITSAKLPITTSTPSSPGLLNFLVTAARAGGDANLDLELTYSARFVEHQINDSESAFGYTPSQWLRFVLERNDDPLTLSLGAINVPVPVRAFPAAPVLQAQLATQTAAAQFDASVPPELRWNYSTRLGLLEQEAQDALWVRLTYNQPLSGKLPHGPQSNFGTIEAVFEALASFTTAWPALQPAALALQRDAFGVKSGSPTPQQVIKALLDQISGVTSAWAAWCGLPGMMVRAAAPAAQTSTDYVLSFSNAFDEQRTLQLFAQGEYVSGQCDRGKIVWPTINGQSHGTISPAGIDAPTSGACWFVASYDYAPLPDAATGGLEFVWPSLDVATRQTANSRWWIVRNANLAGARGAKTNQGLIYQTPEVAFHSPVVPIITMPAYTCPSSDTLTDTIERALSPFALATSSAAKERLLKISVEYSFEISAPAGGGAGLWSDLPILLANDVQLASDHAKAATENALTLHDLANQLAADCERWFEVVMPSTDNAVLNLGVTLFANVDGSQVPIVLAPQLAIRVPQGGWPST